MGANAFGPVRVPQNEPIRTLAPCISLLARVADPQEGASIGDVQASSREAAEVTAVRTPQQRTRLVV